MTWLSDPRKVRAFFVFLLLIAVFLTLVAFDAVPRVHRSGGPVPWVSVAIAWMLVFSWGSKLRRLPRHLPEEQTTSKAD
ncbi:MAG TPA: hypothetical protein VIB39_11500 [Candidatus Angelobacter sp.]|jgi:hypothetical protein